MNKEILLARHNDADQSLNSFLIVVMEMLKTT